MKKLCLAALLVFLGLAIAQEDTLVYYDFESGLGDWTCVPPAPEVTWHTVSDVHCYSGNSWWCGNEEVGGYTDAIIMAMYTPEITLPSTGTITLNFKLNMAIEDPPSSPANVGGGWIVDGWDAFHVRISTNGGTTWRLIEPNVAGGYPYDTCFGFVYNEETQFIAGWCGSTGGWVDKTFDLSSYAGQTVVIGFFFGADVSYSTADDPALFGVYVDNIEVSPGVFFDDGGDTGPAQMTHHTIVGYEPPLCPEVTTIRAHSGTHSLYTANLPAGSREKSYQVISPSITIPSGYICRLTYWAWRDIPDENGDGDGYLDDFYAVYISTDDGANWTWAAVDWNHAGEDPSWAYVNGNTGANRYNESAGVTLDLSIFSGMSIKIAFAFYYDGNNDGGAGQGVFIDDVAIIGFSGNMYDAAVTDIFVSPPGLNAMAITGVVRGVGVNTVNPNVFYRIKRDTAVVTTGFMGSVSVAYGQTKRVTRTWTPSEPGEYTIYVWTVLASDEDHSNDTMALNITVPDPTVYRYLGFEDGAWDSVYWYAIDTTSGDTIDVDMNPYLGFTNAGIMYGVEFRTPSIGWRVKELQAYVGHASGTGGSLVFGVYGMQDLDMDGILDPEPVAIDTFIVSFPDYVGWVSVQLTTPLAIPDTAFFVGVGSFDTIRSVAMYVDRTAPMDNKSWIGVPDVGGMSWWPFEYTLIRTSTPSVLWIPGPCDFLIRALITNPTGVEEKILPGKLAIRNFPNPFNPSTAIEFSLPEAGNVNLVVYDISGKIVKTLVNGEVSAGVHRILWDGTDNTGRDVSSGIYFYKIVAGGKTITEKMTLVR